ncbi:MAG: alpha/beta hydrolase [Alphaproteobacteria bacterium]|nr:alpha/beta hydrolase [Alphaproteobacteria bacterium]MBU1560251.1 alpha/beta hydrolase [Alphaproteobacteria bacterium]MBU2303576.1 alpha/beta hydrolase [Alphaproteobacteria bacterium]MBU2366175.1 alpha/beta hydrolase [Alphaproteobacteria bacterium]
MSLPRPALDPELRDKLAAFPLGVDLDPEILAQMRQYLVPAETYLEGRPVDRKDLQVPSTDGAALPVSVFRPVAPVANAPCIYWLHGGGMVMGDRFANLDIPLEWLAQHGAVVVTIDYRLAPEVGGTTLVEDCYQGLLWIAAHAGELGIDPGRIIIAGASAGGGLAAGTTLLARDRNGPAIAAQILICPMLDHRNATVSSQQYARDPGVWTREKNIFAWQSVLAGHVGAVPSSVSPALERNLAGLPTTYIDAGSAELFRDEDVAYASGIWAAGGQAELHVWAGGFHGFDAMLPQADVSTAARSARSAWLSRVLNAIA